jgi:hypothetical protein
MHINPYAFEKLKSRAFQRYRDSYPSELICGFESVAEQIRRMSYGAVILPVLPRRPPAAAA